MNAEHPTLFEWAAATFALAFVFVSLAALIATLRKQLRVAWALWAVGIVMLVPVWLLMLWVQP